jgi:hypothetical protein
VKRVAFTLAVAAVVGVCVAACSTVIGLGDPPVVTCGHVDAGPGTCGSCTAGSCCAELTACAASNACSAYEGCLATCGGDYGCRAQCFTTSYTSAAEIPALDTCIASSCSSECGLVCDLPNTYTLPEAGAACARCLAGDPCDTARACATSLGCQQATQCALTAKSADELFACPADGLLSAYVKSTPQCVVACGYGSDWTCTANLPPPPPATSVGTTITLNLEDYPTFAPLPGATVKACRMSDGPCATPIATETTDAAGNVTFTLGLDPPFGFTGYFDVQSPTTYPSLLFLQKPLSVPRVTFPSMFVPQLSFIQTLYASAGVPLDTTLGTLQVQAHDCESLTAANVTAAVITPDAGVAFRYFDGDALTAAATDSLGYAVALGAPVYTGLTVGVTPASIGQEMEKGFLFARPGTWSYMALRP